MSYKALYRKYRSQSFDELIGQENIVQTLKNALTQKKIAHAYLFCGPRGTGKTSVARLLAKSLNCSQGVGCQCNECDNCIQITEGTHPDVIEIDAASNSGVDEVRNLIDKIKYSPIKGKYKVYIIDEVHMMTNNAFNALLKTLEEPPEDVVFVLCTTEPHKIMPTILSRCQRFEFKKIPDKTLKEHIEKILQNENCTADSESINLITEIANGGARDALSILDQLITYCGNNITTKDIETVFGLVSKIEKLQLLDLIAKNDNKGLINFYNLLKNRNIDISRLNNELLDLLRDSLIYKKTNSCTLLNVINENDAKYVCNLFNDSKLIAMVDLLLKCQAEFKTASNPYFLFEIYLLKLTDNNLLENLQNNETNVLEKQTTIKETNNPNLNTTNVINNVSQNIPTNNFESKPIVPETHKESAPNIEIKSEKDLNKIQSIFGKKTVSIEIQKSPLSSDGEQYEIDKETLIKLMVTGNKKAKEEIVKRWSYLDLFSNDNDLGPFAALLKDGAPYIVTKNVIVISFNYDRQAQKCNIKENQNGLAKVINKISGASLFVYGLNRKVLTDATHEFLNLKQVNKLPNPKEIGDIEIKK